MCFIALNITKELHFHSFFHPHYYMSSQHTCSRESLYLHAEVAPSPGIKRLFHLGIYDHPATPLSLQHPVIRTHIHGHTYEASQTTGPTGRSAVERVATCQSPNLCRLKRDISPGITAARPSPYILPPLATIAG